MWSYLIYRLSRRHSKHFGWCLLNFAEGHKMNFYVCNFNCDGLCGLSRNFSTQFKNKNFSLFYQLLCLHNKTIKQKIYTLRRPSQSIVAGAYKFPGPLAPHFFYL
jgi:hypothetical protein